MIRMKKLTDYGIVILAHLAREEREMKHTARSVCEATRLPQPTVSKLLKLLTRRNFLISHRGANGGYSLAVEPQSVTVAAIIEALEGPIGITECSVEKGTVCEDQDHCQLSAHWPHINLAVRTALVAITLSDISRSLPRDPAIQDERSVSVAQD